jgi:transposase
MNECSVYVGLDAHKETIAVAIAFPGRRAPLYRGEISNTPSAVKRLIGKLSPDGEVLRVCYEAGPCGYGLQRQISAMGHDCMVVAPGLIPRKAGERVKTDRRDALSLARLHRAGELTAVWVPGPEQEAMRDLTRAREDLKAIERSARQRLGAFLLRHGHIYTGKSRWTQAHFRWIERLTMASEVQQIVLQEYVDTVLEAQRRVAALVAQMRQALATWSLRPAVEALMALRGVQLITAMTVLAELGDLTRFDSPTQLMAYLGLVPSEHSSGGSRRQGGITKTGNGHARRVLVEAAWAYRFPARKSQVIQRRAEHTAPEVQAIAWQAQKRLCARYRHLIEAGKIKNQATTAVARELAGFIWAIAQEVQVTPAAPGHA